METITNKAGRRRSPAHLKWSGLAALALLALSAGCGEPESSVADSPSASVERTAEALKPDQVFTFDITPPMFPKAICGLADGTLTVTSPDCTITIKTTCTFNDTTKICTCTSTITSISGNGC